MITTAPVNGVNVPLGVGTICLTLSFCLGLIVFHSTHLKSVPWFIRLIYYAFNSLIIFAMAMGSAKLAGLPAGGAELRILGAHEAYAQAEQKTIVQGKIGGLMGSVLTSLRACPDCGVATTAAGQASPVAIHLIRVFINPQKHACP